MPAGTQGTHRSGTVGRVRFKPLTAGSALDQGLQQVLMLGA